MSKLDFYEINGASTVSLNKILLLFRVRGLSVDILDVHFPYYGDILIVRSLLEKGQGDPPVSVIIPTTGRRIKTLSKCLESIIDQEYSGPLEILLVLGPFKRRNLPLALNIGLILAQNELVFLVEDDVILLEKCILREAVRKLLEYSDRDPSVIAIEVPYFESRGSPYVYEDNRGYIAIVSCRYLSHCIFGCHVSFKHRLLQNGGFLLDFDWGYEDLEFGYRLSKRGFKILRLNSYKAFHYTTTGKELRKTFMWGRAFPLLAYVAFANRSFVKTLNILMKCYLWFLVKKHVKIEDVISEKNHVILKEHGTGKLSKYYKALVNLLGTVAGLLRVLALWIRDRTGSYYIRYLLGR